MSYLESITYDDGDFDIGSHDDHVSSLDDFIPFGLQEFDNYEDPQGYSCKNPSFRFFRALYK